MFMTPCLSGPVEFSISPGLGLGKNVFTGVDKKLENLTGVNQILTGERRFFLSGVSRYFHQSKYIFRPVITCKIQV